MSDDLMEMPLRELLEKFAAGKHKPGSGSAAALLGLVSCALSRTVIALTVDRPAYAGSRMELEALSSEIKEKIQPMLQDAFVQDSVFFDRVISARKDRDIASDHAEWWRRSHRALSELDSASSIALNIAQKCIRMTELAITVFDKGFRSAQGDSEVAIEAALSGAKGALSVVYLNLCSFRGEAHAKKTLDDAEELARIANAYQQELDKRMEQLRARAINRNSKVSLNAPKLMLNNKKQERYSNEDLRQIVRNLHFELWNNRNQIWTDVDQLQPVNIIDPSTTFSLHGYDFEETVTLGQEVIDGERVEIAGYVDNEQKLAKVSRRFPPDVRRFTSAHELGHAFLHAEKTLFRDRALDGGAVGLQHPQIEREADTFATFFLMPEVPVREIFSQIFENEVFGINKNTAFALGFQNLDAMRTELPTVRHVSARLATTRMYSGRPLRSLCEIFGVSQTAMAIRIEELSLIRLT
jgi:formiminotetrahydrofolate cyclodeaminase/Zn-dependent peptidase ImmA (M78 family)